VRIVSARAGGSACPELLSDDPPQRLLQRLPFSFDVLSQGIIEKGLIITAARRMNLVFEPLNEIVVETDRDTGLPRWSWNDRPSPSMAEVIFFSHRSFS
jgi:hypothetical protein